MNKPQVGASPFAGGKIPLSTSSGSSKIVDRAVSSVDRRPPASARTTGEGRARSNPKPKPVYKGIYFDPSVARAMESAKNEKGASYSFQVNQAMKLYLDL